MRAILIAFESSAADLEKLRQGFLARPSGVEQLHFWGWVGGFLLLVLLFVLVAKRVKRAAPKPRRVDYMTVAVDVLGLTETDRRLLLRIAAGAGLSHPASMLLSPRNLAHAVETAAAKAPSGGFEEGGARLCKILFDTSMPSLKFVEATMTPSTASASAKA